MQLLVYWAVDRNIFYSHELLNTCIDQNLKAVYASRTNADGILIDENAFWTFKLSIVSAKSSD